jgi:hypothetical protein
MYLINIFREKHDFFGYVQQILDESNITINSMVSLINQASFHPSLLNVGRKKV